MVILVTGASGFIGGHLCKRLVSRGYHVHGISRGQQLKREGGLLWWRGDLADPKVVSDIVSCVRPQIIFHLASRVTGSRDPHEVLSTFQANLASSVNVMTSALDSGCKRVVLAGSSEEPTPDQDDPPCSPYAAAKASATNYARMFRSLFHEHVVVARIFMTYGPGQRDLQKLLPYTILSLMRGGNPKLTSGRRLVDWIYIDDVVEVLLRAGFSAKAITFDLGSGTLVSVREVVEIVAELVGNGAKPEFGALPDRPFEQERAADTKYAEEVLGWKPKVSLRQGLAQTIEWYRRTTKLGLWVASMAWIICGVGPDLMSCPEMACFAL